MMKKVISFILLIILFVGFNFVSSAFAADSDNYLSSTKMNKKWYVRWDTKTPIRVYIDKSSVSLQWADEVRKAFEKWQYALSGVANIVFVSDASKANIVCSFEDVKKNPDMEQTLGYTVPSYDSNYRLGVVTIKIGNKKTSGSDYTHIAVYNTALHEAGHALGIWGHSPYYGDLMYPVITPLSHTTRQNLSARDKKTIRMLYETPADITQSTSNY